MSAAGTQALRRTDYRCQGGSPVCILRASHAHHVLPRGRGGKDTLDNLVALCHPCHTYVHANPAWSYEAGLLARTPPTTR